MRRSAGGTPRFTLRSDTGQTDRQACRPRRATTQRAARDACLAWSASAAMPSIQRPFVRVPKTSLRRTDIVGERGRESRDVRMSREPYISSPLSDANALQSFSLSQETYRPLPPFFPAATSPSPASVSDLVTIRTFSIGSCGHRDHEPQPWTQPSATCPGR